MKFTLLSALTTAAATDAPEWKVIHKAFSAVTIGIGFQDDKIGWTTSTDGASLPGVVKTVDGGATWNPVQNQTGIHVLITNIAAQKGDGVDVVVVGAAESDMWSLDGEHFLQSLRAPVATQDAKFQNGKVWIGGAKGPCHSSTGGALYNCIDVPLKHEQTGRYVSAPSADVLYFTAGSWPSDSTERVVQKGSEKHHRLTQHLRVVHDESTGAQKFEMGIEELKDDPVTGYVAELWKSIDGGNTWKALLTNEGDFYFNDIHCIDETHCVTVAEGFGKDGSGDPGARIFLTTDGETFNEVHRENTTGAESLMAARMLSQTEYWAGGTTYSGGFLKPILALHSKDGGQTHTNEGTDIHGQMITAMDFVSPEHGYATAITAAQTCNLLEFGGSTPPAPTPSPTPGAPHYEKPPCQDDEVSASVTDTDGSICAPSCTGTDCPTDVPEGVTAEPTCALKDPSGNQFCALLCQSDDMCDSAGGAHCAFPQAGAPGICVYPSAANGVQTFLTPSFVTV
jgi:photosystem II stability/assembly factor-like uncharacterized protein